MMTMHQVHDIDTRLASWKRKWGSSCAAFSKFTLKSDPWWRYAVHHVLSCSFMTGRIFDINHIKSLTPENCDILCALEFKWSVFIVRERTNDGYGTLQRRRLWLIIQEIILEIFCPPICESISVMIVENDSLPWICFLAPGRHLTTDAGWLDQVTFPEIVAKWWKMGLLWKNWPPFNCCNAEKLKSSCNLKVTRHCTPKTVFSFHNDLKTMVLWRKFAKHAHNTQQLSFILACRKESRDNEFIWVINQPITVIDNCYQCKGYPILIIDLFQVCNCHTKETRGTWLQNSSRLFPNWDQIWKGFVTHFYIRANDRVGYECKRASLICTWIRAQSRLNCPVLQIEVEFYVKFNPFTDGRVTHANFHTALIEC